MNQWLKVASYTFIGIILGTLLLGILAPNGSMNAGTYGSWNMPGQFNGGYDMNQFGAGYSQQLPDNNSGMGMGMHGGMGMRGRR